VLMEAPVVMVGIDLVEGERRLCAGELACPCGGAGSRRGVTPGGGRSVVSGCCARAGLGARRVSGHACAAGGVVSAAQARE
jgi:hypothetical protein